MHFSEKTTTAVSATLLFVFGMSLFGWNMIIWKQMLNLRNDVYSLSNEIRRNSKNNRYLQTRFNVATMRVNEFIDHDEVRQWNKENIPISVRLSRWKRSNGDTPRESIDEPSNSGTAKKTIRRKRKNKRRGSRRRGSKARRKPAASPPKPTSQNVTAAFHFTAIESKPVSNGVITSWRREEDLGVINFDSSQISANGKLRVLKSGVYFIYGKVVFSNVRSGQKKFAHLVVANGGNTKPFSTCVVAPSSERESRFQSCNLSGIKRLTIGQYLQLDIFPPMPPINLYSSHPATYFGGFWIGN